MALHLAPVAPAAACRLSRPRGVPSLVVRRRAAPARRGAARAPLRAAASLGPLPGAGAGGHALLAQLADAAAAGASGEDAAAAAAAAQLAANKSGFLGGIANVLESTLEGIDGVLAAVHVPYSYGFSIIALTLLVKVVTFPLSKKQIESTTAMQALQPRVKDLQARGGTAHRNAGTPEKAAPGFASAAAPLTPAPPGSRPAGAVRQRPGAAAARDGQVVPGGGRQPAGWLPADAGHAACFHRLVPRADQRGVRRAADGGLLLDPVAGRAQQHG